MKIVPKKRVFPDLISDAMRRAWLGAELYELQRAGKLQITVKRYDMRIGPVSRNARNQKAQRSPSPDLPE